MADPSIRGQVSELRFNADYSHWYTSAEMVYGDLDEKFDHLQPIFERARFMRGRIDDPGCIQVPVLSRQDNRSFVMHFREMWVRTFMTFCTTHNRETTSVSHPKCLESAIFYSRTATNAAGEEVEVSDRWEQSLLLNEIGTRLLRSRAVSLTPCTLRSLRASKRTPSVRETFALDK